MILYIARHGETEWNKVRRMQGQTDIPLAENGIKLAKECGRNMKDLPIDLVISSPLSRAVQTAEYMTEGRNIPFRLDDRIKEISFGDWEGRHILDPNEVPKEFSTLFFNDPMHGIQPPHGETFPMVCRRTKQFLEELENNPEYKDKHILISTHGGAGRSLLLHFYEDKNDLWRGGVPKNCAISIVESTDGVRSVIEKDHLFYAEE